MNNADPALTHTGWSPSAAATAIACFLGGLAGLGIVTAIEPVFPFPNLPEVPLQPSAKDLPLIAQHQVARGNYYSHNYAISFAILGGCMAAAVAIMTTKTRKLASLLAGSVLAASAGAAVSYFVGRPLGVGIEQSKGFTIVEAGQLHLSVWLAMVVGLAFGIGWMQAGWTQALKAALSGLVAGGLAITVYLIAASVLFLSDNLGLLIPLSSAHKAFWLASCTLVLGLAPVVLRLAAHRSPAVPAVTQ